MSSRKGSGLFVTLEGGEGGGKSSVAQRLQRMLMADGREVILTREPGSTPLGEAIRDRLLARSYGDLGPDAETLLFLAARAQHLAFVIRPALDQGKIVLCDRFNDSTIAYQGYGRGLDITRVSELCRLTCEGTEPDLTLLLDLDPELGLERATRHFGHDRLEAETLAFHERVRAGFLRLAQEYPRRIRLINAALSLEEVVLHAYGELKWSATCN